MKRFVVVHVLFVLLTGRAIAQDSMYSFSVGYSYVAGTVDSLRTTKNAEAQRRFLSEFVPVRMAWFRGSRESGGWDFGYETQLIETKSRFADDQMEVKSFYNRKVSLAYEFYGKLTSGVLFRLGPVFSGTFSSGTYCDNYQETGYLYQYELHLGLSGDIQFFPFYSGIGMVDDLHLYIGGAAELGLTKFLDFYLSPRVGFGLIL